MEGNAFVGKSVKKQKLEIVTFLNWKVRETKGMSESVWRC